MRHTQTHTQPLFFSHSEGEVLRHRRLQRLVRVSEPFPGSSPPPLLWKIEKVPVSSCSRHAPHSTLSVKTAHLDPSGFVIDSCDWVLSQTGSLWVKAGVMEGGRRGRIHTVLFCFCFLEMRERSELLQLDFQRYSLFKQILKKKKKKKEVTMWVNVFGWRGHVNDFLQTFNCCCSSLFSRANTVFVSLFLLIEAWMDFLSFPTDLKTQNMWNAKNQQHKKQWGFKIRAHQNTSFPTYE